MTYIQPVIPLLILLLAASALAIRRHPRLARVGVAAGCAALLLWSWLPAVKLLHATLEFPYTTDPMPRDDADVIVVLSASMLDPAPPQMRPALKFESYSRTRRAAWLYHHWKALPVLASGGRVNKDPELPAMATEMANVLVAEGVPREMVWTETKSQSTYENAVFSARILHQRGISRIALVTDGMHMMRAERCFRKQGLVVAPAPSSMISARPITAWTRLVPSADNILANENCLHEWVALLYYWFTGKI